MVALEELLIRLDADTQRLNRELAGARRQIRQFDQQVSRDVGSVRQRFEGLARGARIATAAVTALAGAMVVREFVRAADTMTLLEGRLRLVTDSSAELEDVQQRLFKAAQDTRAGLQSTTELYVRLAQATRDLNVPTDTLIGVTTTLQQAFQVSGATAEEASNAVIQLAQGLAAGALRGEEFNSINEQGPRIMQALADSLGVTRGELRDLAGEGRLTADVIIQAMTAQSDAIQSEFDSLPRTVGQALTQLRNDFLQTVDTVNETTGATDELNEKIDGLRAAITDPAFVQGLAAVVGFFTDLATQAANVVTEVNKLTSAFENGRFLEGIDRFTRFQNIFLGAGVLNQAGEALGIGVTEPRSGGVGTGPLAGLPNNGRLPPPSSGAGRGTVSLGDSASGAAAAARQIEQARDRAVDAITDLRNETAVLNGTFTEAEVKATEFRAALIAGGVSLDEAASLTSVYTQELERNAAAADKLERLKEIQKEIATATAENRREWEQWSDTISSSVGDVIGRFDDLRGALADLAQQAFRYLTNKAIGGLFSNLLGSFTNLSNPIPAALNGAPLNPPLPPVRAPIPGRAAGGPVLAGMPYVVGERRPELFVPETNGRILPNVPGGGGGNTYLIDARGADMGAVQRIERALITLAGPGVTERRAVDSVVSARNRNPKLFR